jgi:adenine-specific DNA-methyltransferase
MARYVSDQQEFAPEQRWPSGPLHPLQQRFLAEDLVRLRRSDEQRRYAAPQRAARIDPNPHQIEAVIFALSRVREGGCILADEVGLGKTIEAGLVIAQLFAEGARRVLLIAPRPLLGQWKQELFQLFDLEAREGEARVGGFDGDGIFLIGREAAGSERGQAALLAAEPFDLCVIDEAHEVFAGIYKRFDAAGDYEPDSPQARIAGRVREVLQGRHTPVLLLTATPIQNTLTELWGLVQYVDPRGTLLGDLSTFREVFCGTDDRTLAVGQEQELRSRIAVVLQRTLRREAQEFLEKPFVERHAKLFEYTMRPAERELYDEVTRYLLEPGIVAFQGSHRQLLLLGFHRRMASSTRALAASLAKVAARLRKMLRGDAPSDDADARELADDLEETEQTSASLETSAGKFPPGMVRDELQRVERFIQLAEAVSADDSKFHALLRAFTFIVERARAGQGAGKLVVFTESLVTQEYLRVGLIESRLLAADEVTLFRGTNDDERARSALAKWRAETPQDEGAGPSVEIATRLALVHEFKTHSKVFIATEAGAKGLNLQFCDTVVNYDLPWNPQRIEQRIGRCHRYGQQHSVTVINFLARDNEAQRLTYDILSQKLELFGTVLSATDEVLHRAEGPGNGVLVSALGAEFEAELRRIYDRARTLEEVTAELKALRERVAARRKVFEETHEHTSNLIEDRFGEHVRRVFKLRKESLPRALAELDRDLLCLVQSYLDSHCIGYRREPRDGSDLLHVVGSTSLPSELSQGITVAIGASKEHRSLHLAHPLAAAAIARARSLNQLQGARISLGPNAPPELTQHRGKRAHLQLVKLGIDGFERVELLLPVVVVEDGSVLEPALGEALLHGTFAAEVLEPSATFTEEILSEAVEEVLFGVQASLDVAEHPRFERAAQQAERFIEDRLLVHTRRRQRHLSRLEEAQRQREGATGADARSRADLAVLKAQTEVDEVDAVIARLSDRDDEIFRSYRDHIHGLRYAPPHVQRLVDMELVIT